MVAAVRRWKRGDGGDELGRGANMVRYSYKLHYAKIMLIMLNYAHYANIMPIMLYAPAM